MQLRAAVVLVMVGMGASCSHSHQPSPAHGAAAISPVVPDAPSPPAAPPTEQSPHASASDADVAAAPTAAPLQLPERTGAPGDTRGTISCGETRCTAPGEGCFAEWEPPRWECRPVPPISAQMARHELNVGVRCDDGFDCPSGETCCTTFGSFQTVCVKRGDVPAICLSENCVKDGARCPPGRSCTDTTGDEGVCKAPEGPATCVGKVPCPADKPICALADRGPICVADGSPEHARVPGNRRYHCTQQQDCHLGDVCQYVFGEIAHPMATYCGPYSRAFMGSKVCDASGPDCHPPPAGPLRQALPWMGVR